MLAAIELAASLDPCNPVGQVMAVAGEAAHARAAFAVWLLDCYASSGSLDLSMHVGIFPCRSHSARMRAASLVKSHRWQ